MKLEKGNPPKIWSPLSEELACIMNKSCIEPLDVSKVFSFFFNDESIDAHYIQLTDVEFNNVLTNFSKVCSNTWAHVRVWYFNKNKMLRRFRTLFLHLYQPSIPLALQGLGLIKVCLEIIRGC